MRKDSLIIFSVSIVLTLGIVGGAHYLYLQNQKWIPGPTTIHQSPAVGTTQPKRSVVPPAKRRTSTPIKCTKPDGSVFWTNAARCEDADLNNRLSFADPVKPVPRVKLNSTKTSKSRTPESNSKRLKSIPRNMKQECKFPVGKAQEIEKDSLRLKDNPAESIWKDSYCRWVCEARMDGCENIEEYLGLTYLCPRRSYSDSRDCDD
jgi:hypothetical protein